jgi:CBS domain containing-hemolysin-like protein
MKSHHTLMAGQFRTRAHGSSRTPYAGLLVAMWFLTTPSVASASLLSPENEDKVANFLAVFVLFVVPVVLITLFWMVHVLPEKIAHKRHHPQLEGIRTLCFLSLAFGGLLWPLAWLWAYTKPVGYKLAYGTDKHPDYFTEHGIEPPAESEPAARDLRNRLLQLEERGVPADTLRAIRADLDVLEARLAAANSEAR